MRFIRTSILALLIYLIAAVTVYAEENLTITSPDAVYPGQGFALELHIDQPDVTKITFELEFDHSLLQTTSLSVVPNSGWEHSTDMRGHVVWRDAPGQGTGIVRFHLLVKAQQPGTHLRIIVKNIVLWTGDTSRKMEDVYWDRTIPQIASDDTCLSELRLEDCAIAPEFSPYQMHYTATVPYHIAQAKVIAIPRNEGAVVQVDSPVLDYGKTAEVTVTVTAENGSVRVYTIAVTREDDPNRIPSDNCNLQSLEIKDYKISPVFDPDTTDYVLWLPYETAGVEIIATPADSRAMVTIMGNKGFKVGQDDLIYVTCTAEDGTQKNYIITAKRAEPYAPQPSETSGNTEAKPDGTVYTAFDDVPVWVYVIVVVAAVTGCAAVAILITARKK